MGDIIVYIAINVREDEKICLVANDLNDSFTTKLDSINRVEKSWSNYILGIVDQLLKKVSPLKGFNAVLGGDVPIGAGLSSSAAVECATIFALNELFILNLGKLSMVKLAQKAEHEFAGVQCGIMDQFANMFGKKDHVIRLDCRSLEYEYFPFCMDEVEIVLFDTQVKHSLASSEYNLRRSQCEEAVALIQKYVPEVKSLRDVTLGMLEKYLLKKNAIVYNRCKYIVEENIRLQAACNDLVNADMKAFGERMYATHEGLSKLYVLYTIIAQALR